MLPVVPMFHANAWGFPFTCTLVGAKQVFPGPHLDPQSLLDAFVQEEVTVTAACRRSGSGSCRCSTRTQAAGTSRGCAAMIVGGSAAPRSMIEGFEQRHGLHVTHAWGMTEMAPLGTVSELTSREPALPRGRAVRLPREAGHAGAVRRDPRPRRRGPRALGRQDDGRARGARRLDRERATTTTTRRPTAGRRTAGSRPATSSRSSRPATSRSRTARRTSSSRAASGSRRWRSRTRSWAIRPWPRRP